MTEKRFAEVDFNYNNQTMLMTCVEISFSVSIFEFIFT